MVGSVVGSVATSAAASVSEPASPSPAVLFLIVAGAGDDQGKQRSGQQDNDSHRCPDSDYRSDSPGSAAIGLVPPAGITTIAYRRRSIVAVLLRVAPATLGLTDHEIAIAIGKQDLRTVDRLLAPHVALVGQRKVATARDLTTGY